MRFADDGLAELLRDDVDFLFMDFFLGTPLEDGKAYCA